MFKTRITEIARELGIDLQWVDDGHANLRLDAEAEDDDELVVDVVRFDDTVELSVTSWLEAESIDDLPASLSSALLRLNTEYTSGFWTIEETDDGVAYAAIANLPLAELDAERLEATVETLGERFEALDTVLERVAELSDLDGDAETDQLLAALDEVRATELLALFEEAEADIEDELDD